MNEGKMLKAVRTVDENIITNKKYLQKSVKRVEQGEKGHDDGRQGKLISYVDKYSMSTILLTCDVSTARRWLSQHVP